MPPLIADAVPHPSAEAMESARRAEAELSRFDAELGDRIGAFAPILLRSEAASSSQIENLTASARAILNAELGVTGKRNALEIVANTRAMQAAIRLAESISAETILEMHAVLMAESTAHRPGQWRNEPVWTGTRSDSPVGAEYVAPRHGRVPELVDDVVSFLRAEAVPPLVAVAVSHAQFETIHPFSDGNGRTGRALAQAVLRHRGVTRNIAVPVSAGLLANVEGYHQALTEYRCGNVSPIVEAFAAASLRAIGNARQLVQQVQSIRDSWPQRLKVRRSSNAWRLLDVIVRRPVLTAAVAAEELGVQTPNIYPALRALGEAGILRKKDEYRSGPFWRSDEVLHAVDAFAERAGRRSA
ncbi:Fic family protein [Zhihengliuella alba]|uniref:Fic family protein n=1 Tax=Zhihengliuella alba TaxID=547018 RepID=UPI0031F11C60